MNGLMTMISSDKTKGQILYEWRHPKEIRVVLYGRHRFARLDDSFLVPNPEHQVPWDCLTEKFKQSYEEEAKYHWLTTEFKATVQ